MPDLLAYIVALVMTFTSNLFSYLGSPSIRTLVFVFGTFVAVLQLGRARRSFAEETQRRKQEYSLTYSLTKNQAHIEARSKLMEVFGTTSSTSRRLKLVEINQAIDSEEKIGSHIRLLLNHWENLALAVNQDVADEETAFQMVAARLVNTVHQYAAYIEDVHVENPIAFKHLIAISQGWNKKLGIHKRLFNKRMRT